MNSVSQEETIYEAGHIKITNLRAIIGAKTYSLANITSVSMTKRDPNSCLPIGLILLGAISILLFVPTIISRNPQWDFLIGGLIILGIGIAIQRSGKPYYFVRIGSASGESDALRSLNQEEIRRIVGALNDAIVRRG